MAKTPLLPLQGTGEASAEKNTSGLVAEGRPEARSHKDDCVTTDSWSQTWGENPVGHGRVCQGRGLDGAMSGTTSLQK